MGRKAAVTQKEVFKRADEIQAEGGIPTVLRVHESFGKGSYSTFKKHLDEWAKIEGNSIHEKKRFNVDEVEAFKLIDKMFRNVEYIGTKSVARAVNTTNNMRKAKQFVDGWALSRKVDLDTYNDIALSREEKIKAAAATYAEAIKTADKEAKAQAKELKGKATQPHNG